jgi:hypothetical protein
MFSRAKHWILHLFLLGITFEKLSVMGQFEFAWKGRGFSRAASATRLDRGFSRRGVL